MTALLYIFPILFTLIAIAAFFVNLQEPKGKMIFLGIAFFLVIILAGNEISVYLQMSQLAKLEEQVQQNNNWKTGQIARMNTILASMSEKAQTERDKLASLATLGWSSRNPIFIESYTANEAIAELIDFMPDARHKVVITNLPEAVDKMLMSFALEEMGFIVSAHQVQSEHTAGEEKIPDIDLEEVENEDSDFESEKNKIKSEVNGLHFGHLVRNNDIKLVLYALLRAGIPINHVKVFRKQTKDNARQIKFVYSKSYEKRPAYTVEKIQKVEVFKR